MKRFALLLSISILFHSLNGMATNAQGHHHQRLPTSSQFTEGYGFTAISSFAPQRPDTPAWWFVDGSSYMSAVADAIDNAKEEIFIAAWWLSPEIYLKRPSLENHQWRLDSLLERKASEGVKIFVLLFKEIEFINPINSSYTQSTLVKLNSQNIKVLRHPEHFNFDVALWEQHEKFVSVDQNFALLGGIDLCFGRWDDYNHRLHDFGVLPNNVNPHKEKITSSRPFGSKSRSSVASTQAFNNTNSGTMTSFQRAFPPDIKTGDQIVITKDAFPAVKYWVGKDYSNFFVKDFRRLDLPYEDLVDRTTTPRIPWHDIGAMVHGAAARDVARHFIQRWNAVIDENPEKNKTYPYLVSKSYEYFGDASWILPGAKHKVKCQVLRSISAWSGGTQDPDIWEESIHEAYITSIAKSKHYIYIENQFFVSLARPNPYVKNQIGEAICKRIMKAHKEGKKFRVFVIIPLLPGFEGDVGGPSGTVIRGVLHWEYASISRGNDSIISRLQESGIENPSDYITFHALRTHSKFLDDHVTELIYVHSKLMIVDDRLVLCGSANINDRSLIGKRDSELGVLIEDEEFVDGVMNGETIKIGIYASSLRKYLFSEHLGILACNDAACNDEHRATSLDFDITDPISNEFYNNVWKSTSQKNTQIYEEVFRCLPSDKVTTFTELKDYQEEVPLVTSNPMAAILKIKEIQGHLVDLPLNFLKNEVLTPDPMSLEGMAPTSMWTK